MTLEPRRTRARIDDDGVKIVEVAGVRRGVWLLVLALLVVGAAGLLALRLLLREGAQSEPEREAAVAAAPGVAREAPVAAVTPRRVHPVRRVGASQAPPPTPSVAAPAPTPPELPAFPEEPDAGPSGIGLFPPPGTNPPKGGLLVPEGFELPEGYVRHYQATDDGQGLPAILMFHPDFEWLDENGVAIPLPPDLIVPPELAPPGMPIQPFDPPKPEAESAP